MADEPSRNEPRASRWPSMRVLVLYPLIAVIAWFFATEMFRAPREPSTAGLRPGEIAPPIAAEGWLNGDAPGPEDLAGRVIVLDAWFAACPHCSEEAPELIAAYERFRDKGVVFLGLTPDETYQLADCRKFLKKTGITWPNGYGAGETLEKYLTDGPYFPAAWVIGADGRIFWNRDSPEKLDEAIEQALTKKK
jgi:peroxiredoxin